MSTNLERVHIDQSKIVDYLLSETHPDGKSKAAFFLSHGFLINKWALMVEALKQHAAQNPVKQTISGQFGIKYVVEGQIATPDGRNPVIRSVWIQDVDEQVPRLVTAYPIGVAT